MIKLWPIPISVAVFLFVGLGNFLRSSEGGSESARLEQARLDAIPFELGPWKGKTVAVSEKQLQIAEAHAHLSRRYDNKSTNESINVLILYGTPGALGAHTPDVCYGGAGYRQTAIPHRRTIGTDLGEFWALRFEKEGLPPEELDVMWALGSDGKWSAPDNPRFNFTAKRFVHKLYAAKALRPDQKNSKKSSEEFLELFLSELKKSESHPSGGAP